MTETITMPRAHAPLEPSGREAEMLPARQHVGGVQGETGAILDMIVRAATDPAVDVDKMERLMAMHERLLARQAESQFNNAMMKTQAETRAVVADSNNPQTKSRYASYLALDRALRPLYTKNGFSLSFDSGDGAPEGYVRVLCYVGHKDGHTRTYRADMPADGKGAKGGDVMTKTHAAGSAFTYGQRYLLKLIFNVAISEDDDDGNAAGAHTIDAEQKEILVELLRETGADTKAFLSYMKAPTLDELPAAKFASAKAALEKKKAKAK